MTACTFFGHRDCPENIEPILTKVMIELITVKGVTMFYVGNQGRFDQIALKVLRILKDIDSVNMDYAVVLAYVPSVPERFVRYTEGETMLPEGIEQVHPKFAISWRNDWMLRNSDYVVTYTTHSWGGAARYAAKARKMRKNIINIYQ